MKDPLSFLYATGEISPNDKFIRSVEEFNLAGEHILQLLTDASMLFDASSYGSSLFLSITALEEIGKVIFGLFKGNLPKERKKNLLYNHKEKQKLGIDPVMHIGEKLKKIIGENRLNEITNLIFEKSLSQIREKSIYLSREAELHSPKSCIDKKFAQEILLFVIESFDRLVGWTSESLVWEKQANQLFERHKSF